MRPDFEKNCPTAFRREQILQRAALHQLVSQRRYRFEIGVIETAPARQTAGRQLFPRPGQNRHSHAGIESVCEMFQRSRANRDLDRAGVTGANGDPEMVDLFRIDAGFRCMTNDLAGDENEVIRTQSEIAALINPGGKFCHEFESCRGKGRKASA